MNFNHTILKEEIDTILAENKKGLKTYIAAHYAYLLIGILTTLYFLKIAVNNLKIYGINFMAVLSICTAVILLMVCRISIRTYKAKMKFADIHKLELTFMEDEQYNIVSDEEKITVNDTIALNWSDIFVAFIYKEYIVLASKKDIPILVKPENEEEKSQICSIVENNKGSVVPLDASNLKYNENTRKRAKKKGKPIFIIGCFLIAVLVYMSISKNMKSWEYNPEMPLTDQLKQTYEIVNNTAVTNVDGMFEIYSGYVKYNFNTLAKIDDCQSNIWELWLYDNEEVNKYILDRQKTPKLSVKKSKYDSFDNTFCKLAESDEMNNFKSATVRFDEHENGFMVWITGKNNSVLIYDFGARYITCQEIINNKVKIHYTMAFSNTSEENITSAVDLLDLYSDKSQNSTKTLQDYEELFETYSDIELIE